MKPEPLKNKQIQKINGKLIPIVCFHRDNIKSAVEWLKEELIENVIWKERFGKMGITLQMEVLAFIDLAFEDVGGRK